MSIGRERPLYDVPAAQKAEIYTGRFLSLSSVVENID